MRSEQLGLERHRNLKGLRQLLALLLMAEFEQRLHWLDCLLLCKGSTGEIARRSKCPKLREGQYVEYPLVLSRFSFVLRDRIKPARVSWMAFADASYS